MSEELEVHRTCGRGQLTLTCGPEAFARVLAAVVAETGSFDDAPDPVRVILFERAHPAKPPARWHDRVLLLGCSAVGFVLLFVLAVGVQTLAGWAS